MAPRRCSPPRPAVGNRAIRQAGRAGPTDFRSLQRRFGRPGASVPKTRCRRRGRHRSVDYIGADGVRCLTGARSALMMIRSSWRVRLTEMNTVKSLHGSGDRLPASPAGTAICSRSKNSAPASLSGRTLHSGAAPFTRGWRSGPTAYLKHPENVNRAGGGLDG